MKALTFVFCCLLVLSGCSGVTVKTHHGFMGPDSWEATDGQVSVSYYNGDCCCVAERVLLNLAAQANRQELDWSKMADPEFSQSALAAECKKLQGNP
jgi:hypothetical protein